MSHPLAPSMTALSLLLSLAAAAAPSPSNRELAHEAAVRASQPLDVVTLVYLPPLDARCRPDAASLPGPAVTGRVAIRFEGEARGGRRCVLSVFAQLRVQRRAARVLAPLAEGAALGDAVAWGLEDLRAGHDPLAALPEGATAARALPAGTVLERGHVRQGPAPGTPVTVVLVSGPVTVERAGRSVPCGADAACAVVDGGRRVRGAFRDGRLWVTP